MLRKIRRIRSVLCYLIEDISHSLSFLKKYREEDVLFAQLRQYAHILDKGLHIVPFEKGHGKKVYLQCMSLKNRIIDKSLKNDAAFLWVESVLKKYEQAQQEEIESIEEKSTEFGFTEDEKKDFYKIIKSRVSCRNFTNEKIPDEIFDEIIEIAADAPSGCCRHTERYYIISESDRIKELAKNIAGATGFSGNIPYLVCITADTRPYGIKDRLLPYIDVSLSIQNFLLACTVNNIHGTPLNFQHATNKEIKSTKKILNIPEYERIILFVAIGRARVLPFKPQRISVKQIRKR